MDNSQGRPNILVVEDEEGLRASIKRELGEIANVTLVSNATEALQMMENELPDLLVTDFVMPGLDGIQLVGEVRSREWLVPTVILSGYDSDEYRRAAQNVWVCDFLSKPFLFKELRQAVEKGLRVAQRLRHIDKEVEKYFSDTETPSDLQGNLCENIRQAIVEKLLKGQMEEESRSQSPQTVEFVED